MKKLIRIIIIAILISTPLAFSRVETAQAVYYTIDVDTTVDDPSKTACTLAANDCSLRGAISFVNADTTVPSPDYYIQLGAQSYTLTTHGSNEDVNATGDLDIDYPGTVYIVGIDTDTTIIDGDSADRVFDIHDGIVILYLITVTNGNAGGLFEAGGGVNGREDTNLYLLSILIDNNSASDVGGGLAVSNANVTINTSIIQNNSAPHGGGIHAINSNMNINQTRFLSNTATVDAGGGLFTSTSGVIKLYHTVFIDNTAGQGGGIFNTGASVSIEDSVIRENTGYSGSGVANYYGSFLITRTELSGNIATSSATLVFNSGTFTLRDVTIANNTALYYPGIVASIYSGDLVGLLDHVTITGNGSSSGNSVSLRFASGTISLKNTILNSAENGTCELLSPEAVLISLGYNIANDSSCNLTHGSDHPNMDPLLHPLGDHGGFSYTAPPLLNSIAVDSADPVFSISDKDQRGFSRMDGDLNGVVIPDIGASEMLPPMIYLPLVLIP